MQLNELEISDLEKFYMSSLSFAAAWAVPTMSAMGDHAYIMLVRATGVMLDSLTPFAELVALAGG